MHALLRYSILSCLGLQMPNLKTVSVARAVGSALNIPIHNCSMIRSASRFKCMGMMKSLTSTMAAFASCECWQHDHLMVSLAVACEI